MQNIIILLLNLLLYFIIFKVLNDMTWSIKPKKKLVYINMLNLQFTNHDPCGQSAVIALSTISVSMNRSPTAGHQGLDRTPGGHRITASPIGQTEAVISSWSSRVLLDQRKI